MTRNEENLTERRKRFAKEAGIRIKEINDLVTKYINYLTPYEQLVLRHRLAVGCPARTLWSIADEHGTKDTIVAKTEKHAREKMTQIIKDGRITTPPGEQTPGEFFSLKRALECQVPMNRIEEIRQALITEPYPPGAKISDPAKATMSDFVTHFTRKSLKTAPNLGPKSLDHIANMLATEGMHLREK